MTAAPLVTVDSVWKKFPRTLRAAMFLSAADFGRELLGFEAPRHVLRDTEFWVLRDFTVDISRGECLGVVGRNGSGKSTLLKLIAGIYQPDRGEVTVKGRVGALIDVGAGFHPDLDGIENVYVNGTILGMTRKEIDARLDSIVSFAEIGDAIRTPVKFYSSGMYVRLGFAIAAHAEPDVLLIDEVLAVGDLGFRAKCYNKISELMNRSAVVLVSHSMQMIGRYSSRVVWVHDGQAVVSDRRTGLIEEYLASVGETVSSSCYVDPACVLHGVRLLGACGRPSTVFETGTRFEVELDVTLSDDEQPVGFVGVVNHEHTIVAVLKSEPGEISNTGSRCRVSAVLESLPLTGGAYTLTIALYDSREWRHLMAVDGATPFVVSGSPLAFGPTAIRLAAAWRTSQGIEG